MWGCQDVKPTGILLQKEDKQAASHPHCPEMTPKLSQDHISTLSQRKLVYSLQKNTAQRGNNTDTVRIIRNTGLLS